ncbi:MAG: HAMP domain-containing histidine kinase [Actinomycetota bacterium]|nr:HAMP domain-containing histidine kinase [Actinomycetota bacterium]
MIRLRSIRNQLTLLFSAITLVAVAGVYLYVVPQLESNLRSQKLRGLAQSARLYSGDLVRAIASNVDQEPLNQAVRRAADRSNLRVTLLGVSRGARGLQTYPISDSTAEVAVARLDFRTADDAARRGDTVTGSGLVSGRRLGEAARPLFFNGRVARVVVFSTPLDEVQRNVAVIRRQVAIAGAIAVAFAVLAGFLVARAFSRRIKRLEVAAENVAAGDFSHPITADSDDELGQLAAAFNVMQRQLAQLDTARKRFIATASHELRTPMFSLGGFAELLQDEELDEETRQQFLGQLREQTTRLQTLAGELLDLSRLEAGSLELRTEETDLRELARTVAGEFTPAMAQHDSRLELRLSRAPIHVECDPERVAQVMRILIANAIAHTPQGTDVYVSARRINGTVRLAVRDHGRGIKQDMLPRIFEPFFTADDVQGSGLGLAIARELAERMEGRLGVESAPGRTIFTFELPA